MFTTDINNIKPSQAKLKLNSRHIAYATVNFFKMQND